MNILSKEYFIRITPRILDGEIYLAKYDQISLVGSLNSVGVVLNFMKFHDIRVLQRKGGGNIHILFKWRNTPLP